jgi:hypothetical protein
MIFGFLRETWRPRAVAVAFIMSWHENEDEDGADQAVARLAGFRDGLYSSLGMRRDVLFEACDALACRPERVHMLAELCLEPECRRGHGGVYDALNSGEVRIGRLRRAVGTVPLRPWDDGRIRLACDVSNWLRPDAQTSPERLFCHVYARGKGNAQMIPGWPYSWVAALEPGRTSWTLPLDAVRLGPEDDATEVTAAQLRDVVARLIAAGHWREGDPDIIIVLDAGYDLTRLAWLLADLPVDVTGRLRSDRVMCFPAPPRPARPASTGGRRPRHGHKLDFSDPATWPEPATVTVTQTSRYGAAQARAWERLHQRLERRGSWEHHDGALPIVEGTLIRLQVDHLPGQRGAEPVWLWSSRAAVAEERSEPGLAGVPAPFRYRTYVPVPEAAARLDRPQASRPGCRRPLDLARHRRLRPAPPRPRSRRRHPAALAAALSARPPHPRPRPPRVSPHPPGPARSRQRAETLPARTRPPERLEKPPACHPPRRRQNRQAQGTEEEDPQAGRLNNKLSRAVVVPGSRRCVTAG